MLRQNWWTYQSHDTDGGVQFLLKKAPADILLKVKFSWGWKERYEAVAFLILPNLSVLVKLYQKQGYLLHLSQEYCDLDRSENRLILKTKKQQLRIFPFNPNYISLSKGYQLGLSLKEIDRLHQYRDSGKFINSASAFEQITQVAPSWIKQYSPYFKFPDWVTAKTKKIKKLKAIEV